MERKNFLFNSTKEMWILSGRNNGKEARRINKLDEKDADGVLYNVELKKEIEFINTSYFLGCFGPSIRNLGEKRFREKYQFINIDKYTDAVIEDGIDRALKLGSPL